MKIQYKIVIPFTLLFALAILTEAGVSISLISRALDRRATSQLDHVSAMISQTGFGLNPAILSKLKLIVDAEIVTYLRNGEVIVSTLDEGGTGAALLSLIQASEVADALFQGEAPQVRRDVTHEGTPYKVAYRRLRGPGEAVIAIAMPTADIVSAKRSLARSISAIAIFMGLLMAGLSYLVARSITSPMSRLVEYTRKVGTGGLTHPAKVESRDEVGSLVEAFNDMVRRLRTSEEELLRSEKLAVAGQIAARVAHDVRNPLSSMKMQAQLLRSKLPSDGGNRDSLDSILREIDRVEWVVNGLLDLARPSELELTPADANQAVGDALGSSEAKLRHLKITIQRRLDENLPQARLDRHRLSGALLNLIYNAAEAMPGGGKLVVLTESADHGRAIRIEVEDNGVGIDPEQRDRMFDPFFSTKRDGVGLGLLNTKNVVERHGGTLELVPARAGGTRAIITLPALVPEVAVAGS